MMKRIAVEAIVIAVLLVCALVVRIIPMPYSSGSDIPQFAGFADTFLKHGSCFYLYADGSRAEEENWPYGWPYPYGPILVYILSLLRSVAPGEVEHYWEGSNYIVYVSTDWIIAVKSVLILGDILVAFLLYFIIRKRFGWMWGATVAALYAFNPTTIYISAIYGMFDQLAVLFVLISILFVLRKDYTATGAYSALSLLTKHVVAPSIFIMIVHSILKGGKPLRNYIIGSVLAGITIMIPVLLCPQSIPYMLKSVFSAITPGYTRPIVYSFNGLSSLATFLHDRRGLDLLWVIEYWYIPYFILQGLVLLYYLKTKNLIAAMMLSYTAFVATYWRVNYQYLVPLIALSLLVLPFVRSCKRLFILIIQFIAGFWVIAFPTSWWFHVHIKNPNIEMWRAMDSISLMIFDEGFYVAYSLALTGSMYIVILYWTVPSIIHYFKSLLLFIKRGQNIKKRTGIIFGRWCRS
jgi:hypothetical protein